MSAATPAMYTAVGGLMKQLILCLTCSLSLLMCGEASAVKNENAAWTLHYAGSHDAGNNTCDLAMTDCVGQINTNAPAGPGRYDVYVIATDVVGIAQTRFGLACAGNFSFYGWTSCAETQIPDPGWPGCSYGVTLGWASEQPGPHVTLGILDLYVDGAGTVCSGGYPSLGEAEFCDGSIPNPICARIDNVISFGCVGFGTGGGYSPCPRPLPPDRVTWGLIKSLYVD